jgi:beta-glucosidase
VGSAEHRNVAREAARKSLVMLKNQNQLLPVAASANVLVAGTGADSIEMQTGGWTITWQGTGNSNATFPGATSIFAGLQQVLEAGGGKAVLSLDGNFTDRPDVAIVVFGETPYAEGQGDVGTLAWQQEDPRDLRLLQRLKSQNIPVVTVFLSGRPMWVNAHLNASDAFVAAWLPGSEGAAIADVLVANPDGTPRYDFAGRLSFDWPNADLNADNPDLPVDDILFEYGYGLSYTNPGAVGTLSEVAVGKPNKLDRLVFGGTAKDPWRTFIGDAVDWEVEIFGSSATTAGGSLNIQTYDRLIQEDSVQLTWLGRGEGGSQVYWRSEQSLDMTELVKQQGYLVVDAQVVAPPSTTVLLRMDCEYPCSGQIDITEVLQSVASGDWQRMAFPLSCFVDRGAQLDRLSSPAVIFTEGTLTMRVSEVALRAQLPSDAKELCP